jgi:hypothetical protein
MLTSLKKVCALLFKDDGISDFTLVIKVYPKGKEPTVEYLQIKRVNCPELTTDSLDVKIEANYGFGLKLKMHRVIKMDNIQEIWYTEP